MINAIATDAKNPALILSDKNISWKIKLKFIIRQLWFWGLVALIVFLCIGPTSFYYTVTKIQLDSTQTQIDSIIRDRPNWGGGPISPSDPLLQPLVIVVITHTNDQDETCTVTKAIFCVAHFVHSLLVGRLSRESEKPGSN